MVAGQRQRSCLSSEIGVAFFDTNSALSAPVYKRMTTFSRECEQKHEQAAEHGC
jgi:hypothetical protein